MSPKTGDDHPLLRGPAGVVAADQPRYPAEGDHGLLADELRSSGLRHQEMEGRYGGVSERSFLVHGVSREALARLGKKYGQESVLWVAPGGKREILYTNGPNEGRSHPGNGRHEWWPEGAAPADAYTHVPGRGYLRLGFDFDRLEPPDPGNLGGQGEVPVAKSELSTRQAIVRLHGGLKRALELATDRMVEMRKAEGEALAQAELRKSAPPDFSEEAMHKLKAKVGTERAFKIAWSIHDKKVGKKPMAKAEDDHHEVSHTAHGRTKSTVFTTKEAAQKFADKHKHLEGVTVKPVKVDSKTGKLKKDDGDPSAGVGGSNNMNMAEKTPEGKVKKPQCPNCAVSMGSVAHGDAEGSEAYECPKCGHEIKKSDEVQTNGGAGDLEMSEVQKAEATIKSHQEDEMAKREFAPGDRVKHSEKFAAKTGRQRGGEVCKGEPVGLDKAEHVLVKWDDGSDRPEVAKKEWLAKAEALCKSCGKEMSLCKCGGMEKMALPGELSGHSGVPSGAVGDPSSLVGARGPMQKELPSAASYLEPPKPFAGASGAVLKSELNKSISTKQAHRLLRDHPRVRNAAGGGGTRATQEMIDPLAQRKPGGLAAQSKDDRQAYANHVGKERAYGQPAPLPKSESGMVKAEPNTAVSWARGKGKLPDDREIKRAPNDEGSGGQIDDKKGAGLSKAALSATPSAPAAPKLPMPKSPKVGKAPPMGAGTPSPVGTPKQPGMAKADPVVERLAKNRYWPADYNSSHPGPSPRSKDDPFIPSQDPVKGWASKRHYTRGNLGGDKPKPTPPLKKSALVPGQTLEIKPVASSPLKPVSARSDVGGGPARHLVATSPVQTMTERLASRVPAKGAPSKGHLGFMERRKVARMGKAEVKVTYDPKPTKGQQAMDELKKKGQAAVVKAERYEDVAFLSKAEADGPLQLLAEKGPEVALAHLIGMHVPGSGTAMADLPVGTKDKVHRTGPYVMSWNPEQKYVGLVFDRQHKK